MKRNNYIVIDHLGNDFDNQKLVERKRRIDAQIDEYTRIYAFQDLTSKEEDLVISTIHHLLEIQRSYSSRIRLISAICLN